MTELLIVRHGLSEGNVLGVVQGQMDTALTAFGLQQAAAVAMRIATEYQPVAAVYSSDLERAARTAALIAAELGLPVTLDGGLREMHFGIHQGISGETWRATYPDLQAQHDREGLDFVWPGGGESKRQFGARTLATINHLISQHPPDSRLVIVTHGALIGTYLGSVLYDDLNGWRGRWIANCSVAVLRVAGGAELLLPPDASHLSGLETLRPPDNFASDQKEA